MKKNGQQTRFRDDLRRVLLAYSLVPLLAATLLLLVILGYIPLKNVIQGTLGDMQFALDAFERQRDGMAEELLAVRKRLDVAEFETDTKYRADMNASLYRYVNTNPAHPQFYLLDADRRLLFSTQTEQDLRQNVYERIYWRLLRNLPEESDGVDMVLARAYVGLGTSANVLLGCRLDNGAGKTTGYICFSLPEYGFKNMVGQRSSTLLLTDRFDTVFLGTDTPFEETLGKLRADVRDVNGFRKVNGSVYYIRSADTEMFRAYAVQECGSILSSLFVMSLLVLTMFVALIVIIFISTERVADQKTRIIGEITAACYRAQAGDLNTHLNISSNDEFQVIGQAYNSMLSSIRGLMERSVELGKETALSKVKQLESQFNPHFLFNTLENVRFMIRMDPKAADRMVMNLSSLLRYAISDDSTTVSLGEDLAYIKNYMQIMEVRFGSRLAYEIDVPQELLSYSVPRLIAQPIIENAIKYGAQRSGTLRVRLEAALRDGKMVICISDDGPGIDESTFAELNRCIQDPQAEHGQHFGILNVHDRIRLMYGEAYGIRIQTREGEGTRVELCFPFDEKGKV